MIEFWSDDGNADNWINKMVFNPSSEAAKEKIEELTVDLDIIKTEMDGGDGVSAASAGSGQAGEGAGGAVTNYELKHLQAQVNWLRGGFTDPSKIEININ